MRRAIVVVMAIAAISLSSCSNRIERENNTDTELRDTDPSGIIKTEDSLRSLLKSIKAGEKRKGVTLVGKLHVGAKNDIKRDPSKLTIGKSTVYFSHNFPFLEDHNLVRESYSGETILVRADISSPLTEFGQFPGHKIVNVQHIEILEKP